MMYYGIDGCKKVHASNLQANAISYVTGMGFFVLQVCVVHIHIIDWGL